MGTRQIIKMPDPMLRRKAHKIEKFDQALRKLVEDMIYTMREEPGVGLAAPQVNISIRLIVVEYPLDDQVEDAKPTLFVFANPEIIEKSTETEFGIEGCLSVPELLGEVERNTKIVVSGFDQFGKKQKISASGWLARIFQHEIDHINGVLFVDRARKIWKPEPEESPEKITLE